MAASFGEPQPARQCINTCRRLFVIATRLWNVLPAATCRVAAQRLDAISQWNRDSNQVEGEAVNSAKRALENMDSST
jgi:hypothetical protein